MLFNPITVPLKVSPRFAYIPLKPLNSSGFSGSASSRVSNRSATVKCLRSLRSTFIVERDGRSVQFKLPGYKKPSHALGCVISKIPQQLLHEWPSIFERFVLNAEKHLVQMLPAALVAHKIDFASEYYLSPAFL